MAEKTTHLGMAGHYASMAEFLLRGYNVATPVVDIGDDIYVVDDGDGFLRRVQVKTADGSTLDAGQRPILQFTLSRTQLREFKDTPLFFMLTSHLGGRWRFVLLSQQKMLEYRRSFETTPRPRVGGSPRADADARADNLTVRVQIEPEHFVLWDQRLPTNEWPTADFPPLSGGPGARRRDSTRRAP